MTEKDRRAAALKFRSLLNRSVLRKAAILQVTSELRAAGKPHTERSLYNWCRRFKVSTR